MPPKKKEILKGTQFGLLTVIYEEEQYGYHRRFLCECKCGKQKIVYLTNLTRGKSKSCGCSMPYNNYKHGLSKHPLHAVWGNILSRCYCSTSTFYSYYGGRGIIVCDEWKNDFKTFFDWAMTHGYKEGLSIDRIDNNDIYKPDNCRWATLEEQGNNKRYNLRFTYEGVEYTLAQLCRYLGIPDKYDTVYRRLKTLGWNIERAIVFKNQLR